MGEPEEPPPPQAPSAVAAAATGAAGMQSLTLGAGFTESCCSVRGPAMLSSASKISHIRCLNDRFAARTTSILENGPGVTYDLNMCPYRPEAYS
jgi:hypothetical protein